MNYFRSIIRSLTIPKKIPIMEKWECRDFNKLFMEPKYIMNERVENNDKIKIKNINKKKIDFNNRYETKDF